LDIENYYLLIMNRKFVLIILFLLISFFVFSQEKLVDWKITKIKNIGDSCEINLSAAIAKDWYIFGMNNEDGGPLPLLIYIEDEENKIKFFKVYEISKSYVKYDEIFNVNVEIFLEKAEFKVVFQPKNNIETLMLIIDGQACSSKDGACRALYEEIEIKLK